MASQILPQVATISGGLIAVLFFAYLPATSWPDHLDFLRDRVSPLQLRTYAHLFFPALILLHVIHWFRSPHWKSALAFTAGILTRAIPLYLSIMLLIFGLGLFPITAISNDRVQKFTSAVNRGEITCRREALARKSKGNP